MKTLRYNPDNDRYGIWDNDKENWYDDELHCGAAFYVWYQNDWKFTGIELNGAGLWYLSSLPSIEPDGMIVRK